VFNFDGYFSVVILINIIYPLNGLDISYSNKQNKFTELYLNLAQVQDKIR